MNPIEIAILVLCAAALAVLLWLYFAPLELRGELRRERGQGFSGEVLLELGFVCLRAVPMEARIWQLELALAGVRVARWQTPQREARAPAAPESAAEEQDEGRDGDATRGALARARRHWDLGELLRFLFAHRHLLVFGPTEGCIEFGLEDPALTGELFGYACAARQLSPALAEVELRPLWTFENGGWGWLRGRVRARLVALLVQLALYLMTHYERDRLATASGRDAGAAAA